MPSCMVASLVGNKNVGRISLLGLSLLCALPARAGAESQAAEVDAELEINADPTELGPGETSALRVSLRNEGSFGIVVAVVAVRLPPGLALVSSAPSRGTYDADDGEWTTGEVLSFDSAELVLTVRAETAGASATVVAEVMSIEGEFSAADRDSTPGNGDPCEDDHATATLLIAGDAGVGEGGPVDAGLDCPPAPDAAPEPSRDDADQGSPAADAGAVSGDDTGCGCSGTQGRPTPWWIVVLVVAGLAARTLGRGRTRAG